MMYLSCDGVRVCIVRIRLISRTDFFVGKHPFVHVFLDGFGSVEEIGLLHVFTVPFLDTWIEDRIWFCRKIRLVVTEYYHDGMREEKVFIP
jgi:hypothetical protein